MDKYEYTIGKDVCLKTEQAATLAQPVLAANFVLRMFYLGMDLSYGFKRTLPKFKVIELLARYPYWAWEIGAYQHITRAYARRRAPRQNTVAQAVRHIALGREAQDNEQAHLMLIDDLMRQQGIKQGWVKGTLLPRAMAFAYLVLTRVIYRLRPHWSFAMNAKFESHAEHEYMGLVQENAQWEDEPVESDCFRYYPRQATLADLFRRIGLDERDHMHASMAEYEQLTGKRLC